jgi:hypothetical protein
MKTLKESILSGIDTNLEQGNIDVKNVITFGKRFVFDRAVVGSNSGGVLNMTSLKNLTKDMAYMSDKVGRGQFDKQGKVKMFANLIDHLTLTDLGIDILTNVDDNFRKELTYKLREYCEDNNIFNRNDRVSMWVVSEVASSKDRLDIIVTRDDKISNAYTFRLYYKIEKL